MSIEVKIKFNHLPKLAKAAPGKADERLRAAAHDGESHVKREIASSPAGPGGRSIPGNAPRIDTGYLINNIMVRKLAKMRYGIRSGADYSGILEYGSVRMEPRPYMTPLAVYLQKNMSAYFADFLN